MKTDRIHGHGRMAREGQMMGDDRNRGWSLLRWAILAICLVGAAGWGRSSDAQTAQADGNQLAQPILTGTLRIHSEPPGALVVLRGAHTWKGTTPWDLNRSLSGRYEVAAELSGHERWSRTIHMVEGESRDLEIRLRQKQAWRAGMRSLLLPGWGQLYADRDGKGRLMFLGGAAIAGGLLWTHEQYRDRVDDFDEAWDAYIDTSTLGEELDARRDAMRRAQRRADRAYDRRQLFIYAAGALYAFAFVDSYFFFPKPSEGSFASLSPWGERGPSLTLEGSQAGDVRLAVRVCGFQGGER